MDGSRETDGNMRLYCATDVESVQRGWSVNLLPEPPALLRTNPPSEMGCFVWCDATSHLPEDVSRKMEGEAGAPDATRPSEEEEIILHSFFSSSLHLRVKEIQNMV